MGGGLDSLGGRISDLSLLEFTFMSWEEDQFRFVRFQSLDVSGEGLGVRILSSVVDGDSDGSGEGGGEAGFLQFSESKSFSKSEFGIIFDSASTDNWSQRVSWEMSGSFGLSS